MFLLFLLWHNSQKLQTKGAEPNQYHKISSFSPTPFISSLPPFSQGLPSSLAALARDRASFIPYRTQCLWNWFHWQSSSGVQHRVCVSSTSFLFIPPYTRANLCLTFTLLKYLYTYISLPFPISLVGIQLYTICLNSSICHQKSSSDLDHVCC